jgi:hypothetical protein
VWAGKIIAKVINSRQSSYNNRHLDYSGFTKQPTSLSIPSTDTSELDELRLEVEELKLTLSGYENVKANLSKLLDCEDEPRWKWIVLEVSNMKDELTAARKQLTEVNIIRKQLANALGYTRELSWEFILKRIFDVRNDASKLRKQLRIAHGHMEEAGLPKPNVTGVPLP